MSVKLFDDNDNVGYLVDRNNINIFIVSVNVKNDKVKASDFKFKETFENSASKGFLYNEKTRNKLFKNSDDAIMEYNNIVRIAQEQVNESPNIMMRFIDNLKERNEQYRN